MPQSRLPAGDRWDGDEVAHIADAEGKHTADRHSRREKRPPMTEGDGNSPAVKKQRAPVNKMTSRTRFLPNRSLNKPRGNWNTILPMAKAGNISATASTDMPKRRAYTESFRSAPFLKTVPESREKSDPAEKKGAVKTFCAVVPGCFIRTLRRVLVT